MLYSCSLFSLHQPTDDPLTDLASSSFVLFAHFGFGLGFFGFFSELCHIKLFQADANYPWQRIIIARGYTQ